ncbi:YlmC/YmxH family sporulation protein [Salipaludibacillus neizhouensis]|uniref:YlmC/YmxH family sporulation protein n=1 Tax=Salipaludibacillus neizhouensis TaxID=885475 RepID=A0A3A9KDU8_9BACI|nr:YlmC/YmxH family sporulation protein [Salipaludibacillus neizhouensis]RKL68920.1 YlmC/YmxH family sporulation protein [Salipaludibacillus neizhouensis]
MLNMSELQSKDIVNLSDGKLLGHLTDIDIDLEQGRINSIFIGGSKIRNMFQKDEEFMVPWKNIVKIGSDVILVRLEGEFQAKLE